MLESISFESDRLFADPLCETDTPTLFEIYSDEEAMKYRGSGPVKTLRDAQKMVNDGNASSLRLAIRNKPENQLIGTLLLKWSASEPNQCEVGFSFGKQHWGKGYGTETLTMIEKRLNSVENIKEIKAWCITENFASIRVFEKANFSRVKQNQYPQSILFLKTIKMEENK